MGVYKVKSTIRDWIIVFLFVFLSISLFIGIILGLVHLEDINSAENQIKYENYLQSYMKSNIENFIINAGPPTQTYQLNNGTTLYVFLYVNSCLLPPNSSIPRDAYWCKVILTTNSDNTIIDYRYKGNDCF